MHENKLPADHINHVDCTNNPMDLRPAADAIIRRIEETIKSASNDRKVVVLMGENHRRPTHGELQRLVMQRLLNRGSKFAYAVEQPFNLLEKVATQKMGMEIPDSLKYKVHNFDPDCHAAWAASMAYRPSPDAAQTTRNLQAFCYFNAIPTCFNDAARTDNCRLDLEEERNASLASAFNLHAQDDLYLGSKEIIAIRNRIMVERALAYAENTKTKLVIQKTGYFHLFGSPQEQDSYDHSLATQFQKAGVIVLPVFIRDDLNEHVPKQAYNNFANTIFINGLDATVFHYMTLKNERDFLKTIHKNSGNEISLYNIAAEVDEYQKMAKHDARNVLHLASNSIR